MQPALDERRQPLAPTGERALRHVRAWMRRVAQHTLGPVRVGECGARRARLAAARAPIFLVLRAPRADGAAVKLLARNLILRSGAIRRFARLEACTVRASTVHARLGEWDFELRVDGAPADAAPELASGRAAAHARCLGCSAGRLHDMFAMVDSMLHAERTPIDPRYVELMLLAYFECARGAAQRGAADALLGALDFFTRDFDPTRVAIVYSHAAGAFRFAARRADEPGELVVYDARGDGHRPSRLPALRAGAWDEHVRPCLLDMARCVRGGADWPVRVVRAAGRGRPACASPAPRPPRARAAGAAAPAVRGAPALALPDPLLDFRRALLQAAAPPQSRFGTRASSVTADERTLCSCR